jgi:hypothetical protein
MKEYREDTLDDELEVELGKLNAKEAKNEAKRPV